MASSSSSSSSLLPQTNNLVANTRGCGCPAIDKLIESSRSLQNGESKRQLLPLKWILYHYSEPIQHSTELGVYFTEYNSSEDEIPVMMMLLLIGPNDKCAED